MNIFKKKESDQSKGENQAKKPKTVQEKFKFAQDAVGRNDFDTAYPMFMEVYDKGYAQVECAEALGLIALNDRNDLQEAKKWFTRAANVGYVSSKIACLYLVHILNAEYEQIPVRILNEAKSLNQDLSDEILERIKRLTNKSLPELKAGMPLSEVFRLLGKDFAATSFGEITYVTYYGRFNCRFQVRGDKVLKVDEQVTPGK